jgi:hypothetical protein
LALNFLRVISQSHMRIDPGVMRQILGRFFDDADQTRFALMNAVTAVARDTRDPEQRWNLEELGGGIPVIASGPLPQRPAHATTRRDEAALMC